MVFYGMNIGSFTFLHHMVYICSSSVLNYYICVIEAAVSIVVVLTNFLSVLHLAILSTLSCHHSYTTPLFFSRQLS